MRELDCTYQRICDAAGSCDEETGSITFLMEPKTVADDGSGTFTIRYDDQEADMQSKSYAGPFFWSSGEEMNTLLASSENQFLWHHLSLTQQPKVDIHFMNCRFIQ